VRSGTARWSRRTPASGDRGRRSRRVRAHSGRPPAIVPQYLDHYHDDFHDQHDDGAVDHHHLHDHRKHDHHHLHDHHDDALRIAQPSIPRADPLATRLETAPAPPDAVARWCRGTRRTRGRLPLSCDDLRCRRWHYLCPCCERRVQRLYRPTDADGCGCRWCAGVGRIRRDRGTRWAELVCPLVEELERYKGRRAVGLAVATVRCAVPPGSSRPAIRKTRGGPPLRGGPPPARNAG
jgi:hypothetical protein